MANQDCKLIIENFPIGFIYLKSVFDHDGKAVDFTVVSANKEFEELFKIDRNLILNKKLSETERIAPFSQSEFIPILLTLKKSDVKQVFNKYNLKLNKWFKISIYLPNEHEITLFFSDITQSIQPFSDANILFNIASDLFTISDLNGTFVQVNQVWSKTYGYSMKDVENHSTWEFLPVDEYSQIKNIINSLSYSNEI